MTEKEILIAKLAIFLEEYGAYDSYMAGLAEHGARKNTIDELAEWCIKQGCTKYIIDHSFGWHRVPLRSDQTSWGYLNDKFKELYHSLPYEEIDSQWDNMWDN